MEGTRDEVKGFYSIPLSRQGFLRELLCFAWSISYSTQRTSCSEGQTLVYGFEHCLGSGFVVSVVAAFPRAPELAAPPPASSRASVHGTTACCAYLLPPVPTRSGTPGARRTARARALDPAQALGGRRLHQGDWLVDGFDILMNPGVARGAAAEPLGPVGEVGEAGPLFKLSSCTTSSGVRRDPKEPGGLPAIFRDRLSARYTWSLERCTLLRWPGTDETRGFLPQACRSRDTFQYISW